MIDDSSEDDLRANQQAVIDSLDGATTSPKGFELLLRELIEAALTNGVAVKGVYEIRNNKSLPDHEVLITELEKPPVKLG